MKQHRVIETPPNPFKKGGPPSSLDEYKRDGEQTQYTSFFRRIFQKLSAEKPKGEK